MALDNAAKRYLASQSRGRLATIGSDGVPQNKPVGFTYNAELGTIDIAGFNMDTSAKYRNVAINSNVAFVVDDLASVDPWVVRGVEIRGIAEALDAIRTSSVPAESLQAVFVLDDSGQPIGAASIAPLVRARVGELALSVARTQLAHVHPHWDVLRVSRKMSDFNLTVLPVLNDEHTKMIGVVTVDDLLEELLPQGWRAEFGMSAVEE